MMNSGKRGKAELAVKVLNGKLDVNEMTIKEFGALPARKRWDENIGEFDSIIILPTKRMHESGYRCMDFVACNGVKPICRLSGCSDVLYIDGIGGYGNWDAGKGGPPDMVKPRGWQFDCLKESGLLRLWCRRKMIVDPALSSFIIYATDRDKLDK